MRTLKDELTKVTGDNKVTKTRRPIKRMPIADRRNAISMYKAGGYTYAGLANHFDVSIGQIQRLLGKTRKFKKETKSTQVNNIKIKETINYKTLYFKAVAKLVEHGLVEVIL